MMMLPALSNIWALLGESFVWHVGVCCLAMLYIVPHITCQISGLFLFVRSISMKSGVQCLANVNSTFYSICVFMHSYKWWLQFGNAVISYTGSMTMKICWILFVTSVGILITAFVCAILVLKFIVVPHIHEQAHLRSICRIADIKLPPGFESLCSGNDSSHGNAKCFNNLCIQVIVKYIGQNGHLKDGYLRQKEHEKEDTFSEYSQVWRTEMHV